MQENRLPVAQNQARARCGFDRLNVVVMCRETPGPLSDGAVSSPLHTAYAFSPDSSGETAQPMLARHTAPEARDGPDIILDLVMVSGARRGLANAPSWTCSFDSTELDLERVIVDRNRFPEGRSGFGVHTRVHSNDSRPALLT